MKEEEKKEAIQKLSLGEGTKVAEWTIESKLGEGGFGSVYKVKDRLGNYYAMKVERDTDVLRVLKMEVAVLQEMRKKKTPMHFCSLKDAGNVNGMNYMVMTLVGASLADLRRIQKEKKFSLGCALLSGVQCLEAIEELHLSGFIHRDVKPGNFAIGRNEPKRIFLIDFGMCRKYLDKDNGVRKPRWSCGFRGTLSYASISCHISRELSRRDDLESWLYMVVEFTNGDLIWRKEEDQDKVLKQKLDVRTEKGLLFFFASCPREYVDTMRYIDELRYYDTPKYNKIKNYFTSCIIREGHADANYDWEEPTMGK